MTTKTSSLEQPISLVIITIGIFIALKLTFISASATPDFRLALVVLTFAFSVSQSRINTGDLPKTSVIILRGISLLLASYLLFSTPSIRTNDIPAPLASELFIYQWIAPVIGVLSLWKVAFCLPLLIAMLAHKEAISDATEISISSTDYMPIIEFGLLLTIGTLALHIGRIYFSAWPSRRETAELSHMDTILLTAVSVHFSNYFYSALQKIRISDPWWQWVTDNPTHYLTKAALEVGASPLSLLGDSTANALVQTQAAMNFPLNAAIFTLQLISVFVIVNIRWTAILTALYDVTHIVIFLASGIFFYKWIILNLLIVVALSKIHRKRIPIKIAAWNSAIVILAPLVFFIAFLGWFDTPSFNDEYIEAITEEGDAFRVPSNYFLSGSLTAAQQRLIRSKHGHFLTDTYGSLQLPVMKNLSFQDAQDCLLNDAINYKIEDDNWRGKIKGMLDKHHNYILSRLNSGGTLNYDLYPHHIFSMPWEYAEFYELDKRRISSYRYVVESKCLNGIKSSASAQILNRSEIDVRL